MFNSLKVRWKTLFKVQGAPLPTVLLEIESVDSEGNHPATLRVVNGAIGELEFVDLRGDAIPPELRKIGTEFLLVPLLTEKTPDYLLPNDPALPLIEPRKKFDWKKFPRPLPNPPTSVPAPGPIPAREKLIGNCPKKGLTKAPGHGTV